MSRRVYVPKKSNSILKEANKMLYLLKTAVTVESEVKIQKRIDDIRGLITKALEEQ